MNVKKYLNFFNNNKGMPLFFWALFGYLNVFVVLEYISDRLTYFQRVSQNSGRFIAFLGIASGFGTFSQNKYISFRFGRLFITF